MCKEWQNSYFAFSEWANNNGYEPHLTIERIDVNGDYCPSNCCWISKGEQSNNRRNTIVIDINGEKKNLKHWCTLLGLNYYTIRSRIKYQKWSVPEAMGIANAVRIDQASKEVVCYECS